MLPTAVYAHKPGAADRPNQSLGTTFEQAIVASSMFRQQAPVCVSLREDRGA